MALSIEKTLIVDMHTWCKKKISTVYVIILTLYYNLNTFVYINMDNNVTKYHLTIQRLLKGTQGIPIYSHWTKKG